MPETENFVKSFKRFVENLYKDPNIGSYIKDNPYLKLATDTEKCKNVVQQHRCRIHEFKPRV